MSTENLDASRAAQRQADLQDLLAILIAVGLIAVIHQNGTGPPRLLLALAFTCYVPGRAVVSNWPGFARWSAAATPVAISIAVLAIVATASLWAHHWHPLGIFQIEAVASVALLFIGLIRRQIRHRQGRDDPERAGPELAAGHGEHDHYLDDQYDDVILDEAAEADWRPRRGRTPTARDGLHALSEERWPEESGADRASRRGADGPGGTRIQPAWTRTGPARTGSRATIGGAAETADAALNVGQGECRMARCRTPPC